MREKEVTIETPEKITFDYTLSEIGTRIAAYTIDLLVQGFIIAFVIFTFFIIGISVHSVSNFQDGEYFYLAAAFYLILTFLLKWFYFVFFEVLMEGQSPGKKLMRIRVIALNGEHLDFSTIVLRNFLRAVDGFPVIPVIGTFVAMIDSKRRRLGDLVAGTIVVNEIYFNLTEPDFEIKFTSNGVAPGNIKINGKLSEDELYILRRFLNERERMPHDKQILVANNLANEIKEKLSIVENYDDAIIFIERVYKQHAI